MMTLLILACSRQEPPVTTENRRSVVPDGRFRGVNRAHLEASLERVKVERSPDVLNDQAAAVGRKDQSHCGWTRSANVQSPQEPLGTDIPDLQLRREKIDVGRFRKLRKGSTANGVARQQCFAIVAERNRAVST